MMMNYCQVAHPHEVEAAGTNYSNETGGVRVVHRMLAGVLWSSRDGKERECWKSFKKKH